MKSIDVAGMKADPAVRLATLESFVGFGPEDRAALRDSVKVLGPGLPGLLDAVYEHLLAHDDTRRFFLGSTSKVDPDYLALRKEHLTSWLLGVAVNRGSDADFARWLVEIAKHHAGSGPGSRRVPPRWMVGLTGWLQAAIAGALFDAGIADQADLRRYLVAWNRFLIVQLEMFLHVIAPSFPGWDEA